MGVFDDIKSDAASLPESVFSSIPSASGEDTEADTSPLPFTAPLPAATTSPETVAQGGNFAAAILGGIKSLPPILKEMGAGIDLMKQANTPTDRLGVVERNLRRQNRFIQFREKEREAAASGLPAESFSSYNDKADIKVADGFLTAVNDYKQAKAEIAALKPKNAPEAFMFDAVTMIEKMIPSVALSRVAGIPSGLGLMYGQVYTSSIADVTAEYPELSANEVRMHATARASIESLSELIPFKTLINTVGMAGIKRILGFSMSEGLSEGISSLLQSGWDKGTIKPNLTLAEVLKDAQYQTLLGAVAGGAIASPVVGLDTAKTARDNAKVDAAYMEATGQTREDFYKKYQGPPVPESIRKLVDNRMKILRELKNLGIVAPKQLILPSGSIAPSNMYLVSSSEPASAEQYQQLSENTSVQVEGESVKLSDVNWETTDGVVVTSTTRLQQELTGLTNHIEFLEDSLQALDPTTEADSIANHEKQLLKVRVAEQKTKNLIDSEQRLLQKGRGFLARMRNLYLPNFNLILDTTGMEATDFGNSLNSEDKSRGRAFVMPELSKGVIQINLSKMTDVFGVLQDGILMDTLKHEFGHNLFISTFNKQDPQVQQAVLNGYVDFYNEITKLDENGNSQTVNEFIKRRKGLFATERDLKSMSEKGELPITQLTPEAVNYFFSFPEYVADKLTQAKGQQGINDATSVFFKEADAQLKAFWKTAKEEYQAPGSYELYLDSLAANAALQQNEISEEETRTLKSINAVDQALKQVATVTGKMVDKETQLNIQADLDNYGVASKHLLTLQQLRKNNKHIVGVVEYTDAVRDWQTEKMNWITAAEEIVKTWQALPNKRRKAFNRFVLDLTIKSQEVGIRLFPTDLEFLELTEQYEITSDELALYGEVDGSFQAVLSSLQQILIEEAKAANILDANASEIAVRLVIDEMGDLANSNFFPLSRFGKFYVKTIATAKQTIDGTRYGIGDMISFETFENKKQAKTRFKKASSKKVKLIINKFTDVEKEFIGLPPAFLEIMKSELNFTAEQLQAFNGILKDISPAQSFKQHLQHRKNVPGFDMDALRGYANYFQHFSNHIARIKYRKTLEKAIKDVEDSSSKIALAGEDAIKRTEIQEYLRDHMNYVMNPGNEWSLARAVGFTYFIGLVPISAMVNLTQVGLVTYPYLAARYGDKAALKSLAKAYKTNINYWLHPQRLSPNEISMLETLKKNQSLDESAATEMAGVAEAGILQKVMPGTVFGNEVAAREIRRVAGWSAYLFQAAEKLNRRVTALATHELETKETKRIFKGGAPVVVKERALKAAQDAVDGSQYEYALWNRPRFMRGKKSVLFLFWMFMQQTVFFAMKDPGAMRYLLMMFLVAGLSGLPGAEDIMDIYDYLLRKLNKLTGNYKTKPQVRTELRTMIEQLNLNPDLMMHGLSRYTFNLKSLADMSAVPSSGMDMSGRLGMGRLLPMVEPIFGQEGSFTQTFAQSSIEAGGAVASIPIEWMRAIADTDNPNTLKRFERAFPSFAKMISRTYRFSTEGDRDNDGTLLTAFDLGNTMHQMELWATALGGIPSRVSSKREASYATKELATYYALRRRSFLKLLDHALLIEDDKMQDKVIKEIDKFNATIPFSSFSITGEDITKSIKARTQQRALKEAGIFTDKKHIEVQDYADSAFPEEPTKESSPGSNPFEGISVEKVK